MKKDLKTETSRYDANSVLMCVMVHLRVYLQNMQQHCHLGKEHLHALGNMKQS